VGCGGRLYEQCLAMLSPELGHLESCSCVSRSFSAFSTCYETHGGGGVVVVPRAGCVQRSFSQLWRSWGWVSLGVPIFATVTSGLNLAGLFQSRRHAAT